MNNWLTWRVSLSLRPPSGVQEPGPSKDGSTLGQQTTEEYCLASVSTPVVAGTMAVSLPLWLRSSAPETLEGFLSLVVGGAAETASAVPGECMS